ncbi:hypothetical protein ACFWU5_16795 [Nocardia sp. NPDC058640]|uniref:hypothetical protein n=1 Tax=Nocardia sp. NPDC058640 TaxID=3346571 RepID=UPI00365CE4F7
MTAEEIRAKAIERIAHAEWVEHHRYEIASGNRAWETEREAFRDTYRWWAARMVDALGDMFPTAVEHRAAYAVLDTSDQGMVQRYLTDWHEVTG